jgi:prefoldin subunit 5
MEALAVLEDKIKKLWEGRKGLERDKTQLQRRMEHYEEQKQSRGPAWSVFETIERGKAVGPEEARAAKIRERISAIDRQTQRLEERVERVREKTEADRGEEERESRAALADEFERGIERASERLEEEQRVLERSRTELAAMRFEG